MHTGSTYRRMFAIMGWSQKMSLAGLLLVLITASSVGSLSKTFSERNHGSCLTSAVVSILGAFLGIWFAYRFMPADLILTANQANVSSIVWAGLGAMILSSVLNMIIRARQFMTKRLSTSTVIDLAQINASTSRH